ncbi:hypothetical protein BDN72DRAFT_330218 [Pluteus cervinus]|uniref:Uncharacterized protein n=1 Tax=Pluteus cervinus TaxID=181527 RepID=A0ACD3ACA2_9AGAR|nr:hypothetical protein BDN72DRAFT_330218 [Pluteus cervinus]
MDELKEEVEFVQSPEGKEYLPEGSFVQGCLLPAGDEGHKYFDKLFVDAMNSILELCSQTLRILSVTIDANISVSVLDSITFLPGASMPCLRELTWGTPTSGTSWIFSGPTPPKTNQPYFPALERLHLLPQDHLYYRERRLTLHSTRFIMQHCPRLQYLRSRSDTETLDDAIVDVQQTGQRITLNTLPNITEHLMDIHFDSTRKEVAVRLIDVGLSDEEVLQTVDPRVKLTVLRKRDAKTVEDDWLERISGELGGWRWANTWFNGHPSDREDRIRDAAREEESEW